MHTELVFFDNIHESAMGTLRGFIAACIIVPITALWYGWLRQKIWKNKENYRASTTVVISTILVYLLVVSAIGVQIPNSFGNAAVYGALVGLVVFGCMSLISVMVIDNYNWWKVLGDTAVGVISCSLASIAANFITGVI
jgi:hypothetical protein